jgi:hypothetical protein
LACRSTECGDFIRILESQRVDQEPADASSGGVHLHRVDLHEGDLQPAQVCGAFDFGSRLTHPGDVVQVVRGPSVERSEGTTGFSRWGNRVKVQL